MAKNSNMTDAKSMAPTSELPFAARHCDVPYLDLIENGCRHSIKKMADIIGPGAAAVQYAELTNEYNLQLGSWTDVLKSVEENMKWAHRGGAPDGTNASVCFERARSMLDLAVGQLDVIVDNATGFLDEFCEAQAAEGQAK